MAHIRMMSTESPFIGREQVQMIEEISEDTALTVMQSSSPTDPSNKRFINHHIPPNKWMVVNSVTSLASTMHHGIIIEHQSGNDLYKCIYHENCAQFSHTPTDHYERGQVDLFKPLN